MFQRFTKMILPSLILLCSVVWPVAAQKSGVSPNVLSLPQGPGSLGGIGENVSANLNMGLMSYPIKIILPQGRTGFTPSIGVSYSSGAGPGVLGVGWSLSAGGSIERLTVRGLPKYDSTDRFFAGGELVKVPGTPFYRARIEGGFVRYRYYPSQDQKGYWVAEFPNGDKAYYGADPTGKVDQDTHVFGLQGTFRWEMHTWINRNGSKVRYKYFRDKGQLYLQSIEYVFAKSGKALYKVEFVYNDRVDIISDCKPGFDLRTGKRLVELRITSDGTPFRRYRFVYEKDSALSRLVKVTHYGNDDKSIHPVQFSMKYSNADLLSGSMLQLKSLGQMGSGTQVVDLSGGKADLLDVNGDGLPDVIDTSGSVHKFYLNTVKVDKNLKVESQDFKQSINDKAGASAKLDNPAVQVLDFNGDGFTDLVDASNRKIYLNKGKGRWEDASSQLKDFPINRNTDTSNYRFFDYNGDKKIDVIQSTAQFTQYWVNQGDGTWKKVVAPSKDKLGLSFSQSNLRLIDLNGDGLSDAVHLQNRGNESLRYKKYLGYGKWTDWIIVKFEGSGLDPYKGEIGQTSVSVKNFQFDDLNGDGLSDLVAFVNKGIVLFVNKDGLNFTDGKLLKAAGSSLPNSNNNSIRLVDINGNGSKDIVWFDKQGRISYLELFNKRPNLMTEISNGIGQRINVGYGSSVYHYLHDKRCDVKERGCGGAWKNLMPMAFTVVKQVTTWASRSNKPGEQSKPDQGESGQIQKIYYHDGFYDGRPNEKQFRGFRKVENVIEGDDSQGLRLDILSYNVGDEDPDLHGRLLHQIVTDGAGKVFYEMAYKWGFCDVNVGGSKAAKDLSPPIRFVCSLGQEKTVKEGLAEAGKWKKLHSELKYDSFGNVIEQTHFGEKEKSGDERITKQKFIVPSDPGDENTKWFLRLREYSEICEKTSGPCARIRYYYDGDAFKGLEAGQFTRGNISRETVNLGNKEIHTKRQKYDSFGNVVELQDPNGNLRKVEWDTTYQQFAEKEMLYLKNGTQKLNMATKWDYKYSIIRQSTDFNGHVTRYQYDKFGRLLRTFYPGDTSASILYEYDMKAPISRIVTSKRSTKTGTDMVTVLCYDGLGRKIQERVQTTPGSYLVSSFVKYNRTSKVAKRWNSFMSDKKECSFAPPEGLPSIEFFYDGLGRPIRAVKQDKATVRYEYKPLQNVYYDEEDNRKDSPHFNTPTTLVKDGLGRITAKLQFKTSGGSELRSKYTWSFLNTLGKDILTKVVDSAGAVKQQEFDLLGRITQVTDPDQKTITYAYDDAGNMLTRKDEQGRNITYTYDGLNRLKTIQKEAKKDTLIELFYDQNHPDFPTGNNLKSRIAAITYPGGKDFFSYNNRGHMVQHQRHLLGVPFNFQYEYDNLGRVRKKTYPDGRSMSFQYDGANRMISLLPAVTSVAYGSNGLISRMVTANKTETSLTYTETNRIASLKVDQGTLLGYRYNYDAIGNIMSVEKQHKDQKESRSYQYNAMYQLTQAKLGNETLSYAYDSFDNISAKTSSLGEKSPVHIGDYTYEELRPRAVTKAGGSTFAYDKSGHIIKQNNMEFRKDYLGRRVEVQVDGNVQGRYWYGPNLASSLLEGSDRFLQRTIKVEKGITTLYVSKDYEVRGRAAIIYTRLGSRRVAAWKSEHSLSDIFDDLAPATGDSKLTPQPDKTIHAGDAWLYHAARSKQLEVPLKSRPVDIDLTRTMLRLSAQRALASKPEQTVYYHQNHINSTVLVTDETKKVLAKTSYYPFGKVQTTTGTEFFYGYTGLELDNLTKHNYASTRYLDPKIGRWMSADRQFEQLSSTDDEFNSYAYVRNSPLILVDGDGTMSRKAIAKTLILGALGVSGIASGALWLTGTIQGGTGDNLQTKTSFSLNIEGSVLATVGAMLAAKGSFTSGSKGSNDSRTAGKLGALGGAAWLAATYVSSDGSQSTHLNYAASGLAILAGAAGIAAANDKRSNKAKARLGHLAGVLTIGSSVTWALGTDPSDPGGIANLVGAGAGALSALPTIAFGAKNLARAGRSGLSGARRGARRAGRSLRSGANRIRRAFRRRRAR